MNTPDELPAVAYKVSFLDCWALASLVHKTPHVTISYSFEDLVICYEFDKNFFEIGVYFAYVDYCEASAGTTLELNGSFARSDDGENELTFEEFAAAAAKFLQDRNRVIIRFTRIDYYSIQCYVRLMALVRVEVFDWEEDGFFLEKEMLRRVADNICYPCSYVEKRLKTVDTD